MVPEEGEIPNEESATPEGYGYDPSYEWPGESSSEPSPSSQPPAKKLRPNQPSFRLIVLRSSILSSKQKLAIIDGYSEIQFGRDIAPAGSTTPRARLKEMEVSKLHATAYWDASRREWGVVDMGSVHGTFVRPISMTGDDRGVRLSPSRQASIPRTLKHLDRLTIGGTTFLVHTHEDQIPCEECSLRGKEEIPLFPVSKTSDRTSGSILKVGASSVMPFKDPKKALTMLKHSLLARHHSSIPLPESRADASAPAQYVDRSARRRALMPESHPDVPGISSCIWNEPLPRPKTPLIEPVSEPPAPLPASNIGHRLLMKQGWEPGTALGTQLEESGDRIRLVQPLENSGGLYRGGLGLKRSANSDGNWKESAKRKRWDSEG